MSNLLAMFVAAAGMANVFVWVVIATSLATFGVLLAFVRCEAK